MNTYACWYQGIFGYCFHNPRSGWWFVPELNQPDPAVHRHLQLSELVFVNSSDYRYEVRKQRHQAQVSWKTRLKNLLFPVARVHTVGGLLFLPGGH